MPMMQKVGITKMSLKNFHFVQILKKSTEPPNQIKSYWADQIPKKKIQKETSIVVCEWSIIFLQKEYILAWKQWLIWKLLEK